ncbi:glycosyltransferase [Candidatus Pelagibacter sp.]|nr:glycosyltransferase [Candidatus Pelagibacter sp.]
MKKKVFYWSPFLSKIATEKAVINSASNLGKYFKDYDCYIINAIGEFSNYKNLNLINFFEKDIKKYFPYRGFLKSRISFLIIFLITFFKLKKLLSVSKPDYFIIHLISSLPLILNYIFKFKTKFILRISGFPKINFIRKFFWKKMLKKIDIITCPTEMTKRYLIRKEIVDENKIFVLKDPIISLNEIKNINSVNYQKLEKPYLLAAGRLTNQKNFSFLIKCFKKITENNNEINLIILGEGELRNKLTKLIDELSLKSRVKLVGYAEDIFWYMKNCKCFLVPSLWEDPGFVLIEAAFLRKIIISNNCPNGPKEFFKDLDYPLVSNNFKDESEFTEKIKSFLNNENYYEKFKLNLLKKTKDYTVYQHCKKLSEILVN